VARKRKRKDREAEVGFAEAASAPEEHQRLTPVDVQEKVFRLAFRGYSERDVDAFLDRVTEDLADLHEENKRVREQLAEGGAAPSGLEDAERQAEAIVRQAREHAARLIEDAEATATTAAAGAGAQGDPLPTTFLLRERQFLQQMAALIQDHARRLKEEARRASSAVAAAADEEAEAPAGEPAPSAPSAPPPPPPPAAEPPASQPGGPTPVAAAPPAAEEPAIVLPEPPQERTAPWTQPDEPGTQGSESDQDQDRDPLLSAWESAFAAEDGPESAGDEAALHPSEVRNRKDEEEGGEPSLRELFWGDEG
jgi:DivIVA domain-containing protein